MEWPELKEAFKTGVPVVYADVTYSCVSALIFRRIGGNTITQAELADRNGNSVTIAPPNRIERAPQNLEK